MIKQITRKVNDQYDAVVEILKDAKIEGYDNHETAKDLLSVTDDTRMLSEIVANYCNETNDEIGFQILSKLRSINFIRSIALKQDFDIEIALIHFETK